MSKRLKTVFIVGGIGGAALGVATLVPAASWAAEQAEPMSNSIQLDTVQVTEEAAEPSTEETESYTAGRSATATGLKLTPRETPQSTSVITRQRMEDFTLDDVNEVLASTTGVTVEQPETDRTYYTARGFDITNFQMDGQGIPFTFGNVMGDLDTVIYDRVEVLRGANGLMSGTGTPSATINFIRKRPTADFQGQVDLTAGSWDRKRLDLDVSNALNTSGSVRGRAVLGYEQGDSWLDRYEQEKTIGYGVVEMDLTDSTLLAIGASYQNNNSYSPLWGALPLYRTDGSATDYDRSTSTSTDWAWWHGDYTNVFAELTHQLGAGWEAIAAINHREMESDSKLFYVYGTPDPSTSGSDLYSYPSLYEADNDQIIGDLRMTGPFRFLGRQHQAIVGASYWESELTDRSDYGQGIGTQIDHLENWTGDYPEPAFNAAVDGSEWTDRQKAMFAAAQFSVTDPLDIIIGSRVISLTSRGTAYGASKDTEYSGEMVPYASLTYALNDRLSVYASQSEIFDPQTEQDINGDRLDPVRGTARELGIKGGFYNDVLNVTVAVFDTEQDNLAEPAGGPPSNPYYREGDGIESRGYEVDMTGELTDHLQLAAGYTHQNLNNPDGSRARAFIPEKLFHLSAVYTVPQLEKLKVGARINWQDDIYRYQTDATTGPNAGEPIYTRQDSYALVNLMSSYAFTKDFSATLNLNNVTDEKYLTSLYWADQGFYGAPANAELRLSWKY